MSRPARFLFDECVGKPVMESLRELVPPDADLVHITDYFRDGIKDEEWIPRLAAEGGWVVVTSDGGKHSKHGAKLPDLCRANGLTHVVMSSGLHRKTSLEKVGALAMVWADLLAVVADPPGTRYRVGLKQTRSLTVGVRVVLQKVDPPVTEGDE